MINAISHYIIIFKGPYIHKSCILTFCWSRKHANILLLTVLVFSSNNHQNWKVFFWNWRSHTCGNEWATTCQNQQNECSPSKDSDQPGHPPRCQGWSESSLCAQWVARDPSFLHADSEDSDQTGRPPRLWLDWASDRPGHPPSLIWAFAGHPLILLVLSCPSSFFALVSQLPYEASIYEPQNDKTNKMTCAPSEGSDQPRHLPYLVSLCCPLGETLGP